MAQERAGVASRRRCSDLSWVSLLAFFAFLVIGPLNVLDLGSGRNGVLWLDAGLSLVFFIQHSVMIRASFRRLAARMIPEYYVGALYTIASAVALLVVVALWQESGVMIASARGVARWLLRVLPLLAMAGFAWGVTSLRSRSLKTYDPYGIRPILNRLKGEQPRSVPLVATGPYRWVRHPLYLFMALMIWSYPDLTADRLSFNLLWTAWMVIATWFEERDLVAGFGDSYRKYQREVPMLIPYRIPPKD